MNGDSELAIPTSSPTEHEVTTQSVTVYRPGGIDRHTISATTRRGDRNNYRYTEGGALAIIDTTGTRHLYAPAGWNRATITTDPTPAQIAEQAERDVLDYLEAYDSAKCQPPATAVIIARHLQRNTEDVRTILGRLIARGLVVAFSSPTLPDDPDCFQYALPPET